MKTVYIASDHAGFSLKNYLVEHLQKAGHTVHDLGPQDTSSFDYPNSAFAVTDALKKDAEAFGILVCGTGIGMSMAANRVPGMRAALATCEFHARACRAHNNANILCMGGLAVSEETGLEIVDAFLHFEFEGGRHQRRIDKLEP